MENVPTPQEQEQLDSALDGQELQRPPEQGSDARLDPEVKAKILALEGDQAEPF